MPAEQSRTGSGRAASWWSRAWHLMYPGFVGLSIANGACWHLGGESVIDLLYGGSPVVPTPATAGDGGDEPAQQGSTDTTEGRVPRWSAKVADSALVSETVQVTEL